jgi:hypothetical protein
MKIRIYPITLDLRNDHQRDMYEVIERKRADAWLNLGMAYRMNAARLHQLPQPPESNEIGLSEKSSLELAVAAREVHLARRDRKTSDRETTIQVIREVLNVVLLIALIVAGIWWLGQPESRVNLDCPYTDKANPWRECVDHNGAGPL